MTAGHDQPVEREDPFPPRFRILKRSLVAMAIVIALVAGLRWWWGYEAQRKLDAFVAESHAAGRKVLLADLGDETIPDGENAAVLLLRAAGSLKVPMQLKEWDAQFQSTLPLSSEDLENLRVYREANASAFADARSARSHPRVDWRLRLRSPVMNTLLPHLSPARRLAQFFRQTGLYEHSIGNDREMIAIADDILYQARAPDAEPNFVITHLVSMAMRNIGCDMVVQCAPELKVGNASDDAGHGPAKREAVAALIEQLLDERDIAQSGAGAWESEQLMSLDNPANFAKLLSRWDVGDLMYPMFVLDGVHNARSMIPRMEAESEPDYPAALRRLGALRQEPTTLPVLYATTHVMTRDWGLISIKRNTLRTEFAVRAAQRAAATALAIRLYTLDHEGKLPRTLADLVPAYLHEVPRDPFSPYAMPPIYKPDPLHQILYSVGENGIDDGGSEIKQSVPRGMERDIVFRLHSRTGPATTQSSR